MSDPITTAIIIKANGISVGTIETMTITQDANCYWSYSGIELRGEASRVVLNSNCPDPSDLMYHSGYKNDIEIEWHHGKTVAMLRRVIITEWYSTFDAHSPTTIDQIKFRFNSLEYLNIDLDEPLTTKTIDSFDQSTTTEQMIVVQPEPIEEKLQDPLITALGIFGAALGAFISKAAEMSKQAEVVRVEDDMSHPQLGSEIDIDWQSKRVAKHR
jgi:hypothetical protein